MAAKSDFDGFPGPDSQTALKLKFKTRTVKARQVQGESCLPNIKSYPAFYI
jgi:hypothetical protein